MLLSPRQFACTVLASALVAISAAGQAPQFLSLTPPGGQRGKTVEVTLGSKGLPENKSLFFSHPGLTATLVKPNRFAIQMAKTLPDGDHDVWAVTATGVSNARRFVVGTYPEIEEKEKDDTPETAQEVTLPVVINGTIDPGIDRDHYRFELKIGQHVSLVFRSESLEGTVRPALTVFAPSGRELLHDDGRQAEPVLNFAAPSAGTYTVRVEERAYRAGPSNYYRLSIVTGPRLVAAFPDLLQKGKAQPVTIYGYELPGGKPAGEAYPAGMQQLAVTIMAPAEGETDGVWSASNAVFLEGFRYRLADVPGYLRFGLTDREPTVETDQPHEILARAQPLKFPFAASGRFLRSNEVDWYRFTARKGETLWIEAIGERTGKAMDLDIAIHDAGGKVLETFTDTVLPKGATESFSTETLDPAGVWKVPADGEYNLAVRDLYGTAAAGAERTYWLSVGPRLEGVQVVAMTNPVAPPGGTGTVQLVAMRRGGHEGPIRVRASDLPKGIQADEAVIAAKQNTGTWTMKAGNDAAPWVGKLSLVAETVVDGKPRTLPVIAMTPVRDGKPAVMRRSAGVLGAVMGMKAAKP
ncbi:MAG: PPC domain-containing protein [Planctomycetes bacterium]|nr:PPC domain-containing protein [Planctomycetota bacterium]